MIQVNKIVVTPAFFVRLLTALGPLFAVVSASNEWALLYCGRVMLSLGGK